MQTFRSDPSRQDNDGRPPVLMLQFRTDRKQDQKKYETPIKQRMSDFRRDVHQVVAPAKHIMCDFCKRQDLIEGFHMDPNFDLCSSCYQRLRDRNVTFAEIQILMNECMSLFKAFPEASS